jgi:hypothetical protein
MESAYECMRRYKEDGNTEHLVDVANYMMIEFMYPKHPQAHFKGTDNEKGTFTGMSYREIEEQGISG